MTIEQHCRISEILLGDSFREVHALLDEFEEVSGTTLSLRRHHHQDGISEATRRWGVKEGMAARYHIIIELVAVGWDLTRGIPENEEAYLARWLQWEDQDG